MVPLAIKARSSLSSYGRRLFEVLQMVQQDGGVIKPEWYPAHPRGYVYRGTAGALKGEDLADDLEWLAHREYLDRTFFERIVHCARCSSHSLNTREVCPSCKSADLRSVELLLHYRCAHIAPIHEFPLEDRGRRCPKCHCLITGLGTDHDIPTLRYSCNQCKSVFPLPEIGTVCMGCGAQYAGAEHESLVPQNIVFYRIAPLGLDALKHLGYA
jgi:hypothetical protein